MNVLLFDPRGTQRNVTHNAGLAFLSSSLCNRGHKVRVLDLNNYDYNEIQIAKILTGFDPDWVGFSVKTALVGSAEKTAEFVRTVKPDVQIVVGGPHISLAGLGYLENQQVYDYGICGEAEQSFPDLIEGRESTQVSGLIYRKNGRWLRNPKELIEDIEALPYPTFKCWDRIERFSFPYLVVHSRGCPYHCTFCSVPRLCGRKFRFRTPESIIDELRAARKEYVFRNFEFLDDNLTLNVDHAKRICEALIQADLGVGWYANNGIRADRIDRELAGLMKRSDCKGVAVGIEAADEQILKNIKKGESLPDISRGIRLLKKVGIPVGGHFIVGLPGDSLQCVKKSLKYVQEMELSYAYFNQYVPYPGTELGDWVLEHGNLLVKDLYDTSHFGDFIQIIMETPEFPKRDREEAFRLIYRERFEGVLEYEQFKSMFKDASADKVLVIRSGRMDPYEEIRKLLPKIKQMDVLVSHGIRIWDTKVSTLFTYPKKGMMTLRGMGSDLKKKLKKNYDIVFYVNTLQSGTSFGNIHDIGQFAGKKLYELLPEKKIRAI